MSKIKELKENLEGFIEMLGLEQKDQGDIVEKNNETYYHYLGSEYEEEKQQVVTISDKPTPTDEITRYAITKDINYFSSHDNGDPLQYREYMYDFKITIFEKEETEKEKE